jgi:hypothetical protein
MNTVIYLKLIYDFSQNEDYFKAFQGLQATMVGLTFITLSSFLINLKTCENMSLIFVIDGILTTISFLCGLTSLIIFGAAVYRPDIHQLDWCYWLSVAACCLQFFAAIFIILFGFRVKYIFLFYSNILYVFECSNFNYFETHSDKFENSSSTVELNPRDDYKPKSVYIPSQPNQNSLPRTLPKHQPHYENYPNSQPLPPPQPPVLPQSKSFDFKPVLPRNQYGKNYQTTNRIDSSNNNQYNKYKTVSTYKKRSFKRNIHKPKYRYDHQHYNDYLDSIENERFQPGYTSEPENIEYSIDRSWHNRSADLNQSLPDHLNNPHELTNTFQSRHFVKLPKLIYYDGVDHYSRPSLIN